MKKIIIIFSFLFFLSLNLSYGKILKVAHRGINKFAPENTILAIKKAIEMGFDYVELDVHFSKDGYPVIIHDNSLKRTAGIDKNVSDFTLEELKKIDVGCWKGKKFCGEKIPSLEDALQIMQGKIKLYLDLKVPPKKSLIKLLKKYNFYPENIVIEGSEIYQKFFRMLDKSAPVMPGLENLEDIEKVLEEFPQPFAFNVSWENLSKEMLEKAHKNGILIFVNILGDSGKNREIVEKIVRLKPDAIQTDHPDILLEVLESLKEK
jgi:glycerophosphoryl diester phosphodiesterase